MPTWGEILVELQSGAQFDEVRRKYLRALAAKTGNSVISYATSWTGQEGGGVATSINPEDVQAFMEVVHGLSGPNLDLVLHSPGGSPETTEAIVFYLVRSSIASGSSCRKQPCQLPRC